MPPPLSRCSPPLFVAYKSPCAAVENPSPPLLSTSFSPWLSPASRPNPSCHGRRRALLLEAASSIPELAWSSASPPSFFSPEESTAGASSRRRRHHFPRRYSSSAASNSPPTALLRPSRHHLRAPGEALVPVDPFPSVSAPASHPAEHCRLQLLRRSPASGPGDHLVLAAARPNQRSALRLVCVLPRLRVPLRPSPMSRPACWPPGRRGLDRLR
jgi:hypothetical protein